MSFFGDEDVVNDLLNENCNDLCDEAQEPLFGEELPEGENNEISDAKGDGHVVKVEPKKRSIRNPQPRLTVETLRGHRGIHTIEEYFKDIQFKGSGSEKQDLDEILKRLQHWGHRMYPNYKFDDVLNNIERLGRKKPLQVHMTRYRLGMLETLQKDSNELPCEEEETAPPDANVYEPYDEFDALLDEQIAISKVSVSHVTHASAVEETNTSVISSSFKGRNMSISTLHAGTDSSTPAATLPPNQPIKQLTSDQMARVAENRRLAQERLAAKRLAQQQVQTETNEF